MSTTTEKSFVDPETSIGHPVIRTISVDDLKEAVAKGVDDFKAKPSHIVILFFVYPIVMLFLAMFAGGLNILPMIFPLLAGFALIGPIAAIGLYELSRRRELGEEVSLTDAVGALQSPSIGAIVMLSGILMVIYFAWLGAALTIYWTIFGNLAPESLSEFVRLVFTTPSGWALIVVGSGVGFVFAVVVLAIAAISFPMLLAHKVGTLTAVRTSVRAVIANPLTMMIWGVIVAGSLVLGALPFFVGLSVVMPVLGHATWHLFRKLVVSEVG